MAEVTKEQLLEFIRNNELDLDESYPRSDWWKFKQERDTYKSNAMNSSMIWQKLKGRQRRLMRLSMLLMKVLIRMSWLQE